jgi:hypothetical protein
MLMLRAGGTGYSLGVEDKSPGCAGKPHALGHLGAGAAGGFGGTEDQRDPPGLRHFPLSNIISQAKTQRLQHRLLQLFVCMPRRPRDYSIPSEIHGQPLSRPRGCVAYSHALILPQATLRLCSKKGFDKGQETIPTLPASVACSGLVQAQLFLPRCFGPSHCLGIHLQGCGPGEVGF